MEKITELLEKLGFSKTEASVYIDLLKNSTLTGYQIAKNLNISRSSVYAALDKLYKKGIVFLLPGNTQVYKAESPSILINKMKNEFIETTELLEEKLKELETSSVDERYFNIEGYDNIIIKIKQMLLSAKKEVYINTDFNLNIFAKELKEISDRGIRIIVFSFSKLETDKLPIEIYAHEQTGCLGKETRMMLVVDCKRTLVADQGKHREEMLGTFTDNILMCSIISEHIHNDIYLLKLKNKYKDNLITEDIKLNTILENR